MNEGSQDENNSGVDLNCYKIDLPHGQDATPFDGDGDDRWAARHWTEGESAAEAEGAVAHERDRHNRPEMKIAVEQ